MEAARPGSPVHFDDATLNFVKGGPPPPPTETSTRLQSRCDEIFRRHTEKARTKQASRAMSTREALDAYKSKYGEAAAVEAFGREEVYLASIEWDLTITGTAPRLHWLGPRTYAARSRHAQAIQALDAQRAGAAILPGPGGVVALEGEDDARQWAHLVLIPSSARRDDELNFWEEVVRSNKRPYQNLWDDGNWSGDAPPPEWGVLIRSPSGKKPPNQTNGFYRGPLAQGVRYQYKMTEDACNGDARKLEHWARAEYFARRVAAILKKERKAFEAMRDKSEAKSNGGSGRPTRGPRQSYRPEDDYAATTRAKTEELMVKNPTLWHQRHFGAIKGQLAYNEPLLEAIAKEVGVPPCVLTARDVNDKIYLLSPAIQVDLPGLGSNLVMSNWDHKDKGWKDDPSVAIRELGLRRLAWDALNRALRGYEWYLARDAEREYLEAYLNSTLYCDGSYGKKFVFEIKIDDEAAFWGMKTKNQQEWEMRYIKNHFLNRVILSATEGRADAAWNSST